MEEQNNSTLKDTQELSKRLTEVQSLRAKVAAKINVKMIQNTTKNTLESIKNYIDKEKRNYGVRQSDADKIIEEYKNTFKKIEDMAVEDFAASYQRNKEYEKAEAVETLRLIQKKEDIKNCKSDTKKLRKQIAVIEDSEEYKQNIQMIKDVKGKIEKATKCGNTEEIDIQNKKLKELQDYQFNIKGEAVLGEEQKYGNLLKEVKENIKYIAECREEAIYARKNIKEAIANQKREYEINSKNQAIENRAIFSARKQEQKALAVITRKNIFSKIFDSVKNKVGGAKKFTNKVIEPLKQELVDLKDEKIPGIKAEILSKRKECTETCRTFIEKTKGRIKETRNEAYMKIAEKLIEKATDDKLQPEK